MAASDKIGNGEEVLDWSYSYLRSSQALDPYIVALFSYSSDAVYE